MEHQPTPILCEIVSLLAAADFFSATSVSHRLRAVTRLPESHRETRFSIGELVYHNGLYLPRGYSTGPKHSNAASSTKIPGTVRHLQVFTPDLGEKEASLAEVSLAPFSHLALASLSVHSRWTAHGRRTRLNVESLSRMRDLECFKTNMTMYIYDSPDLCCPHIRSLYLEDRELGELLGLPALFPLLERFHVHIVDQEAIRPSFGYLSQKKQSDAIKPSSRWPLLKVVSFTAHSGVWDASTALAEHLFSHVQHLRLHLGVVHFGGKFGAAARLPALRTLRIVYSTWVDAEQKEESRLPIPIDAPCLEKLSMRAYRQQTIVDLASDAREARALQVMCCASYPRLRTVELFGWQEQHAQAVVAVLAHQAPRVELKHVSFSWEADCPEHEHPRAMDHMADPARDSMQ